MHKLLLNMMTHLSKISPESLSSHYFLLRTGAEFDHCAEGVSEQQVIRYWWIAPAGFGRLETSGCLIRSWHLHLSLWWHRDIQDSTASRSLWATSISKHDVLIITKLAVNLRDLWMTYIHSLLFFLYITAVPLMA